MLSVFDWMQNVMNEGVYEWMDERMNYLLFYYVMNVTSEWVSDWDLFSIFNHLALIVLFLLI